MLTKEMVVVHAIDYLKMQGYEVDEMNKTCDVVAEMDGQVLKLVAMGDVNDVGSTSKKGKGYNKNQIRQILASALGEVCRQMTLNEENIKENYAFVITDSKLYHKQLKAILVGVKALSIQVYVTDDTGFINPY